MIRPIKCEEDYNEVLVRIDALIDAIPGTDEFDELEVLSVLAESWEEDHHSFPSPDPIEALKNIMEWKGLTRRDLQPYIGTKSRVSEILNRKRPLTLAMIMKLKKGLGIPADVLIPDWEEEIPIAL
jgi:HTH-type transcriptional regulator/antitoxin HigA